MNNLENNKSTEIVRLSPDEWAAHKTLRLRALKEDPQAFGKSYAEELKTTDEEWADRLHKTLENDGRLYLFAKVGNEVVGMAGTYLEKGEKVEHLANIIGVYVAPEYRGQGIAKNLIERLTEELKKNPKVIKISLRVNTAQERAVKLYQDLGFKTVGILEKEMNIDGVFVDEYEMFKFI